MKLMRLEIVKMICSRYDLDKWYFNLFKLFMKIVWHVYQTISQQFNNKMIQYECLDEKCKIGRINWSDESIVIMTRLWERTKTWNVIICDDVWDGKTYYKIHIKDFLSIYFLEWRYTKDNLNSSSWVTW